MEAALFQDRGGEGREEEEVDQKEESELEHFELLLMSV
jgi:hypothetical protein